MSLPTVMALNDITRTFGMPVVTAALIVIIAGCRSCAHPESVIRFTAPIRLMEGALIGRGIPMADGAFASFGEHRDAHPRWTIATGISVLPIGTLRQLPAAPLSHRDQYEV
jgi:hypothetical protein